jgi:hypothetical protein
MSEAFKAIGDFFSGSAGGGLLKAGAAGGGFLQNLFANREAQKKQKFVENLVTDPQKWASYVQGFDKPLEKGLTTDIARSTDAYGAERGLGSSPAIMKDVYAQALAPYVQNEQQMAQDAALRSLGLYEQSPTTKPVDITSMLRLLMQKPGQGAPGTQGNPISVQGGSYDPYAVPQQWEGPIQDPWTAVPGITGATDPSAFDPSQTNYGGMF